MISNNECDFLTVALRPQRLMKLEMEEEQRDPM